MASSSPISQLPYRIWGLLAAQRILRVSLVNLQYSVEWFIGWPMLPACYLSPGFRISVASPSVLAFIERGVVLLERGWIVTLRLM